MTDADAIAELRSRISDARWLAALDRLIAGQFPTEEYVDTAERCGGLVACPTCQTPVNEHWLRKRLRSLQPKGEG